MKIKAKPGDVLVLLLYDLMGYSGWRPKDEDYPDEDMRCKAVGLFKSVDKESVSLYQMSDIEEHDEKTAQRLNGISLFPLSAIKKYKNLGRVLDWPSLR
ncbi:hypothetical protein LCGC14_2776240 [marine sediment metagenome]|uniref:Uncharacterized protein n=1 Tax=marine sediment metagenome TaxID=412755 RepID=A0A0F8YUM2_9ZZZZ